MTHFRIQRPPEAFSLSSGKRKRPRVTNDAHLKWIRTLPCVVSGKRPVEAAHIRYADPRFAKRETGKSEKPDDRWTVPLSPDLHREQHSMGEREFWKAKGIDPVFVASALHAVSWDDEAAELILREARR